MICSILFGLGMGLLFMGIFMKRRTNRFRQEIRQQKKSQLVNLLKPLLYLGPIQHIIKSKRSFSRIKIEQLLERAGNPKGIKAEHIILAKLFLPVLAVLIFLAHCGIHSTIKIMQPTFVNGVAIKEISSISKPVMFLLISIFILFNTPDFLLKQYIRKRERMVMSEQGLFSEIIFMSLQARLNLRDALEEAAKTTDYLRTYMQICLNEWHTDRIRALNNLKKNVGVLSFSMIIDLLIQAANVGDEKIAQFLEENKKLEDEIKNLEISAKNKTRPLLLTVQMILPLLVILVILFYPLSLQVESLITNFY